MLKQVRHHVVELLWQQYRLVSPQIRLIETSLQQKGIDHLILDHFAIIDLPGIRTGIPQLRSIFASLGYEYRGKDCLFEKQNDFLWMSEPYDETSLARDMLPQVVVADFSLDEMPIEITKIINKYANQSSAFPQDIFDNAVNKIVSGDIHGYQPLNQIINCYFKGRDWPLPTLYEFFQVQEFNELLAWVLIYGRQPNHYTLSVHLLNQFKDLLSFHQFITEELKLELNSQGGVIKGGKHIGIAQGSTIGLLQPVALSDGVVELPTGFVEFVWRYPINTSLTSPTLWQDFFTGFVAENANNVVESLFTHSSEMTTV